MSRLGLSDHEIELLKAVIAKHPQVTSAIVFGSRAKGTSKPWSDIDIALEGDIDSLRAESVASDLDDLPLPYKFDVLALRLITSQELRDHIARVGVVL